MGETFITSDAACGRVIGYLPDKYGTADCLLQCFDVTMPVRAMVMLGLWCAQALGNKGGGHRLCHDILPDLRRPRLLAHPAALLVCALLRHHEAADQAHDQVPLHPVHDREEGALLRPSSCNPLLVTDLQTLRQTVVSTKHAVCFAAHGTVQAWHIPHVCSNSVHIQWLVLCRLFQLATQDS